MTVTTKVNSLTGNSFKSDLVTTAITTAFTLISDYLQETITEDSDSMLDGAAALLARKILERGRISSKQKVQATPSDYVDNIISKEVRIMLDNYKNRTVGEKAFITNRHPSVYSSEHWRS